MTDSTPLTSLSSALADVVARTAPSVVAVHSHRSRATGFVWKPGLIVTADEALADEGDVEIGLPDGSTAAATIAGRDHTTDIALLRADTAIAPVKLATIVPPLGALSVVVGWALGASWPAGAFSPAAAFLTRGFAAGFSA